jgi:hypothetical protein
MARDGTQTAPWSAPRIWGLGEGGAGVGEAVEMGGLDVAVAEGVDGVGALVVGEDEDDVGAW